MTDAMAAKKPLSINVIILIFSCLHAGKESDGLIAADCVAIRSEGRFLEQKVNDRGHGAPRSRPGWGYAKLPRSDKGEGIRQIPYGIAVRDQKRDAASHRHGAKGGGKGLDVEKTPRYSR